MMRCVLALLALQACSGEEFAANPIRKIVTLMQNMQKEVEAEGAKEKELYDKFMCYCQGSGSELQIAIDKAGASIDELGAKLKSETAEKSGTAQELIQHKQDREGATSDLEEATVLRNKENGEFEATKADMETNLKAMGGAIPALEKGMGGASFVQLPEANAIKKIAEVSPSLGDMDKRTLMSFLEQNGDYAPASGQIVGILKAMEDDMKKSLEEEVADEAKAVSGYGELKASKEKEVELASEAIEAKTARAGELAVSIATTADGLEDATKEKADTEKFVATLKAQCGSKEAEWAKRQQLRAEEVAAISQAIGILNDDDALDVFKKAIPSALIQNSFLQKGGSKASMLQKVQGLIAAGSKFRTPQLSLLLFSLKSKLLKASQGSQNFDEIVKMIDGMVALLGKENGEDAKQRDWCEAEFEKSADEGVAAKSKLASVTAEIGEVTDEITDLSEAINTLTSEVGELDKSVADATANRKADHGAFVESAQLGEVAIGLIAKAKNRMQKFYNPTLYKAAPKTENTMEGKIIEAGTFAQIRSHVAPGEAPETFSGEVKKNEKSGGVLALMDTISTDLANDMKEAEFAEKTAQKEYADLMGASQATRAQDTKSIVDKEAAKATMEEKLMTAKKAHSVTKDEISLIDSYVGDLHVSCDFIMQNFDLRLEARTAEIESLKNAKAVLAGANFGR